MDRLKEDPFSLFLSDEDVDPDVADGDDSLPTSSATPSSPSPTSTSSIWKFFSPEGNKLVRYIKKWQTRLTSRPLPLGGDSRRRSFCV